jgi:PAS domain S-box-containing protein
MPTNRCAATIFSILALLFCLAPSPSVASPPPSSTLASRNILIIHSYHQTFEWTDHEMNGIMEVLRAEDPNYMPFVEYLDWKRFPDKQQVALAREYFAYKYRGQKIDAVIVTDNLAMEFALEQRPKLFPGAAVLFCGINGYTDAMIAGHDRVSGVVEDVDPEGTLNLITAVMPETREIVVLLDDTESSKGVLASLEAAMKPYDGRIKLRILSGLARDELIAAVKGLEKGSVILQGPYLRDREGHTFSYESVIEAIVPNSHVPIFSLWDFLAGKGITGGSLLSGDLQGSNAARMALLFLKGETSVPVMKQSPTRVVLDYAQLKRFGLEDRGIPNGVEVINRPFSFLKTYFWTVCGVAAVVAVLCGAIVVMGIAIRRRHQVEALLRANEQNLATTFDSIGDAVIATDGTGRVTRMNRVAEDLTGWPLAEAAGRPLPEIFVIVNEMTRHIVTNPVEIVLKTGTIVGLANHTVLIARDGTERPIADSGAPIFDRDGVTITGVVLVFRDVTAEYAAEKALRISEEKFSRAFHASPAWMTISTLREGRYLDINETFLRETGFRRDEVIGQTSIGLGTWADAAERAAVFAKIEKGDIIRNIEVKRRTRDGRMLSVLWSADVVEIGGQQCIISATLDVTDLKRLEDESLKAQKLESLSVLAGGIAHDFNNLLAGILGNVSFAKLLILDNHQALKRLNECENASLRARDLTSQLLTFARGGEPVRKLVSLPPLITDSANFALRGSNVLCRFDFSEDIRSIEADEGQLNQVINNLVINAHQAMPEGGEIVISARNVDVTPAQGLPLGEGRYVMIEVRDSGNGIAPGVLPRIFDPYFTTKSGGSGLGLASAYSIVKRHHGFIMAESSPGQGAVFRFYLPASESSGAAPEIPVAADKTTRFEGRVLVMDDEEIIRSVAAEILAHLGFEVVTCSDGGEAVRIFRDAMDEGRPYDVVIMDLTVPGGQGGKETIRQLCALEAGVRAIVSSGYSNDPVMANYVEYGFSGAVSKPFRVEEMAAVIARVLRPSLG